MVTAPAARSPRPGRSGGPPATGAQAPARSTSPSPGAPTATTPRPAPSVAATSVKWTAWDGRGSRLLVVHRPSMGRARTRGLFLAHRHLYGLQRLRQVRDDILVVLHPNRQPHHPRRDAHPALLFHRHARTPHGRGVLGQRFRAAQAHG